MADPRRTKRMVEYRPASGKWDYIGGNKRLPGTLKDVTRVARRLIWLTVQWTQWLTHTLYDPPTLEVCLLSLSQAIFLLPLKQDVASIPRLTGLAGVASRLRTNASHPTFCFAIGGRL